MEIGKIVDNIDNAVTAIMGDKRISRFEMAAELDCLTKFLQVLQQAYVAVYVVMLRLTLITPEDIGEGRLAQIEERIDQLDAAGVGFDIDVVAARLRSLRETRTTCLRALMDRLPNVCDWHLVLSAMDERDTPLINDVYSSAAYLRRALAHIKRDPGTLKSVHESLVSQAVQIRGGLEKAQWVTNRILGLSTLRFNSGPVAAQPQQQRRPTTTAGAR